MTRSFSISVCAADSRHENERFRNRVCGHWRRSLWMQRLVACKLRSTLRIRKTDGVAKSGYRMNVYEICREHCPVFHVTQQVWMQE